MLRLNGLRIFATCHGKIYGKTQIPTCLKIEMSINCVIVFIKNE